MTSCHCSSLMTARRLSRMIPENIQLSPRSERFLDHIVSRGTTADVRLVTDRVMPFFLELRDKLFSGRCARLIDERDFGPFLGQGTDDRLADTPRAAGNQRRFASQ